MTDELRNLLKDVQTVYEGKGMVVHPNSCDKLRMEVIKLDNINKQQSEQIEKMKSDVKEMVERADKNGGVAMKPTKHDVIKSKILSTAKLASEHFLTYQNYCQKIENMLTKIQSKEEINSVLYQMADGIVVAVHRTMNGVDDNIPIEDYLNELDLREIKENDL